MENKERFVKLLRDNVKREGIEKLISMLEKSDFFIAPASTKYHDSCEGGLLQHSLNVYDNLLNGEVHNKLYTIETITIVSLLHDICKIGFYKKEMRNTKKDGKWIEVPYYTIEDLLPLGHGEKSVIMLQEFIKLTSDEILAINAHMGGFDDRKYIIGSAFEICPLAVYLHIADLKASYLQ